MKHKLILFVGLFAIASAFTFKASPAKYFTKNGKVSFFSHTAIEDIDATNNKAASVLDVKTGNVVIEILIKSFAFKKALMEEHFNENYMESTKYPKSKFSGKVDNITAINFEKDGKYTTTVSGKLTIKDKTNTVKTDAVFTIKGGSVNATSVFTVNPADYNIEIPSVVKEKIAKDIKITVDLDYVPMK